MTKRMALCVVTLLVLMGCGTSEESVNLPGDYGQIIETETDCNQLQDIFDTAENSNMERRVDVMEAADERMREVGCYD